MDVGVRTGTTAGYNWHHIIWINKKKRKKKYAHSWEECNVWKKLNLCIQKMTMHVLLSCNIIFLYWIDIISTNAWQSKYTTTITHTDQTAHRKCLYKSEKWFIYFKIICKFLCIPTRKCSCDYTISRTKNPYKSYYVS